MISFRCKFFFLLFLLSMNYCVLFSQSHSALGGLIVPAGIPGKPNSFHIGVQLNSQRLFLHPEAMISEAPLYPYVPFPLSVVIEQNLMPRQTNSSIQGVVFGMELHANGNNAPTIASDISIAWKIPRGGIRLGVAGISSMETNAWRCRLIWASLFDRFQIVIAGETGLMLDLPHNIFHFALAGSIEYSLIQDTLNILFEGRGSDFQRNEFGLSVLLRLGDLSLRFGTYKFVQMTVSGIKTIASFGLE
jgi:hypothetical protein